MVITPTEKLHLRKLVKELKSYKAPHTEFVTVYIPQGYEMFKIIQHLAEEQGTASNIKSSSTRKNVQDALEKMVQHLRGFQKTPPNTYWQCSPEISPPAKENRTSASGALNRRFL